MAEKNMNAKISVEFEETANRQQLSSGDNLPTLFGKIKKIISDLSTSAFSGSYIDLSDRPTSLPANGGNANTVNNHTVNSDVPADAVFTDTVYTLPTATVDTLGGVMVDGTSITADEQGVISALGSGGGGLTLIGRYSNKNAAETTIGTLSDIPEGTKLLFMSTKLSGTTNEIFYCGIGNVPTYVTGYVRSYSNISMINGNDNTLTLQIHNYGPSGNKVTFVGNGSFGTYVDIYKWEV